MQIKDLKFNNEVFKTRREQEQLSMREVEELSGVSRSSVSNIENGTNIPDGVNLLRLMFLFNLSKEDIALSE